MTPEHRHQDYLVRKLGKELLSAGRKFYDQHGRGLLMLDPANNQFRYEPIKNIPPDDWPVIYELLRTYDPLTETIIGMKDSQELIRPIRLQAETGEGA